MPEFTYDDERITVGPGHSLYRAMMLHGIVMPTKCDGGGSCGDCVIEVLSGGEGLDPRTPEEHALPSGLRRACRAHWVARNSDLIVRSPVPSARRMFD